MKGGLELRKYYCDRCGSELDKNDVNHVVVLDADLHEELDELGDLCPNCLKLLQKAVSEVKKY